MNYSSDLRSCGICFLICLFLVTTSTQLDCSPPDVPADGNFEPKMNMYLPGSNVYYFCNDDFILDGSSTRECQFDGTWSETTPFCDQEKTFKILRASMSCTPFIESSLLDGNTENCYDICCGGKFLHLVLEKEAVVRGVKIFFGESPQDFEIYSGLGNNMTLCASYKGYSRDQRWVEINCGSHAALAEEKEITNELNYTEINIEVNKLDLCGIRVLGFGRQLVYGCSHPPEITVANGYFKINRSKATLICEDGYKSENGELDCGRNSWKGLAPRCKSVKIETATQITIGVAVAGVLIIMLLLVIIICLKRR